MLKFFKNSCNIFILLWCLYLLSGPIGFPSVLRVGLQLLIIGISGVNMVRVMLLYGLQDFLKSLFVLLALFTIYGLIMMMDGDVYVIRSNWMPVAKSSYLIFTYLSLLPIYAFYYYTRKGYLTIKILKRWSLCFFVIATIGYFYSERQALALALENGYDLEETTNNAAYSILALLPILAFWSDNRKVQYFGIAFVGVFLLMAMKRGAILIGIMTILLLMRSTQKSNTGHLKIGSLMLGLVVLAVCVWYFNYMMENSDYFKYRFFSTQEHNTSGRDVIYQSLIDNYKSESLLNQIFGLGANATLKVTTNFAHNDWLEILINQGAVGILVYLAFYYRWFQTWRKMDNIKVEKLALGLCLLILFMKTLFSMSYNSVSVYLSIVIGFSIAQKNIEENEKNYL